MSEIANPTKPISRISVDPKAIAGIQMTSDIQATAIEIRDLGLSFGISDNPGGDWLPHTRSRAAFSDEPKPKGRCASYRREGPNPEDRVVAKVEPDNLDETVTGPFGYAGHYRANDEAGDQG
jgi:hypothetical protein